MEKKSEVKSMVLLVGKSLEKSLFLLLALLTNFTLAKRQEIPEKILFLKPSSLLSSPLSKDKLFSVSMDQLQEVNEACCQSYF